MNTKKETSADTSVEITGTSLPLQCLLASRADDLKITAKSAVDQACDLYFLAEEIDKSLSMFPTSYALQDIFSKVQLLLDADQQDTITRLIIGLRKLENL